MVMPPSEFTGIAATSSAVSPTHYPISSACIEEDDNVGWLATEEELYTTVDWSTFHLPPSLLALCYMHNTMLAPVLWDQLQTHQLQLHRTPSVTPYILLTRVPPSVCCTSD